MISTAVLVRRRRRGTGGGAPATPATVDSVTAGTWAAPDQPLTVTATGASNGDGVYWVIVPAADDAPSASEVRAGQANGGGSPTDSGNDLWPGPFSDTLVSGIANGSYIAYVVIDNGALSNVGVSGAFTIDTTAPVLGTPLASESSGDIDWGVTSNEANGEVYAGLRLSANPVLSAENIMNGTGDTIDTDSDDTPAADDTNGGSFLAPAVGTYRVDMVQVDDYGNVSSVVTSAEVEITSADAMGGDAGRLYHFGYDDTTRSGTNVTSLNDKGGNAFDLTGTGASSAPTQADAASPLVFSGSNIIQTATSSAANNLIQDELSGGGEIRLFAVVDGATLGSGISILFSESFNNTSSNSILFSISKDGSNNVTVYASATGAGGAFTANITTGINAVTTGMMIYEVSVTQSGWQIWINGTSVGTGSVTPANFPTDGIWTTVGGRASNAATNFPFTGDFYELFVTGTTDGTTLGDIRSQLATKYSITL